MKLFIKLFINPIITFYFVFAFIEWNLNPATWNVFSRIGCFLFFCINLYQHLKDNQK
jgi:hypothetical protein